MDRIVYDRMAEHDSTHWWYRARRDILSAYLMRLAKLPKDARILEIGCGTGHNLPMLAQFGRVEAVEIDEAARAVASGRLGRPLASAPLPELAGIDRAAFELVAVLDVIEHVEDDVAALATIRQLLVPDGKVLVTVPAHPWMWSAHDEVNHHHRRYTRPMLEDAIAAAGLRPLHLGWFNSLLFPVAAAARIVGNLTGKRDSDDAPPPGPVNRLFEGVFRLERHLVGRVPLTPGVSLIALCEAAGDGSGAR